MRKWDTLKLCSVLLALKLTRIVQLYAKNEGQVVKSLQRGTVAKSQDVR
jgi:hypothetical protein